MINFIKTMFSVNEQEIKIKKLEPLAEQGCDKAQFELGHTYNFYPTPVSTFKWQQAFKWYMKSAKQNNAKACHYLGMLYLDGDGVKKDYDEAFKWHMKSAKLGFVGAQLHLGIYYYCGGYGIEQDYKKAVYWLKKAVKQGHDFAKYYLGLAYYDGNGVKQSYDKAIELWEQSQNTIPRARSALKAVCQDTNIKVKKRDIKYINEEIAYIRKDVEQGFTSGVHLIAELEQEKEELKNDKD